LLARLGLYSAPSFPVETLSSGEPAEITDMVAYLTGDETNASQNASLRVSPLQMALAAASLSNGGEIVTPRLAMAVENPHGGWVTLPVQGQNQSVFKPDATIHISQALAVKDLPIWQVVSAISQQAAPAVASKGYTWYLGGTLPEWKGAPIAMAVLLEENNPQTAVEIGRSLLQDAISP
jgi:hypothetical protein